MSMVETDNAGSSRAWIDYDYALVRIVPRVDLGAFINVGVVLHARTADFLDARLHVNMARLASIGAPLDTNMLLRCVEAYCRVCRGGVEGGPIGLLPPSERFHWLTAPRSAVLQTSAVHPGRCHDPRAALDELFRRHCIIG